MKSPLHSNTFLASAIFALSLAGCGTIKSTSHGIPASTVGIEYFLPAQRIKVELYRNIKEDEFPRFKILIGPGISYADNQKPYTLKYERSVFNDEHLCVARTTEGLLSTVQFSTANRAGDILIRAAETAVMALTAIGGAPPIGIPSARIASLSEAEKEAARKQVLQHLIRLSEVKPESDQFELIYISLFDLQKRNETDEAENNIKEILWNELKELGSRKSLTFNENHLKISFQNINEQLKAKANSREPIDQPQTCTDANNHSKGGVIYYRTQTTHPMKVSLMHEYSPQGTALGIATVPAFDNDSEQCINIEREFLVRKVSRFDFTNGILTGVSINTPSIALAAAELPLRMGSAVIEMPASFFTAIGRSFSAQTALAGREIELINALAKLQSTRANPDSASTVTATAPSGAPPQLGTTLPQVADPYKPLGSLAITLTCWGADNNPR
ncbi:MAG: hypothetical protein LZF61_03935 [Nitrosomonas sp.]|nr:MAG: hypothetical protein LZF61_03935 [Nitrosomonas sp.]